ncbi:MAG TPA: DNA-processing protein DprA [Pirellulales bacterium]|jgi:DNA processing protein|nr:DNA-processing protein DprA [Pirellulales bacterium]
MAGLFTTETDGDDLTHVLRLSLVSGIGPRLRQLLLERFGSPAAVFAASQSELRSVPGIGAKLASAVLRAREEIDVAAELEHCRRHGVSIVPLGSADYPRALSEIADPPGVLFVRGAVEPRDALSIAIVGSRHATRYGSMIAERLAASLSRAGLTIISGLARGVDAAAHRGALSAGGRTIAVLGSGVLNIYPPEHADLAKEVIAHGAVVGEAPVRSAPLSGAFPQRNRLISGMSLGVVVVEAALQSGALITARHAMEQGRDVFAVPGPVDSRTSRGCHQLIRDGAKLVETADDVLEELGPLMAPAPRDDGSLVHHPAELLLNDAEQRILGAVGTSATAIDQVIADCGLPTPQVLAALSVLEMRRLIKRISGNYVVRAC